MSSSFSIPIALSSILAAVLALPGALTIRSTPTPAPATLSLKSQSQLKSEAALYETAIREIGTIANMKLSTVEELKKANDIVAKHIRSLKYSRSKAVVMALSDGVFVNAVKATAKDEKSAEAFVTELSKDRSSILKLTGAESLMGRMQRAVETDTATLKGVAQKMKRSADEVKASTKQHHFRAYNQLRLDWRVEALVYAAFIVNPVVTAVVVANVVPVAIVAVLVARLATNIGTQEGQNKVAECMDGIDKKYQTCLDAAAQLPLGFSVAAFAVCYADWLLDAAACHLIE